MLRALPTTHLQQQCTPPAAHLLPASLPPCSPARSSACFPARGGRSRRRAACSRAAPAGAPPGPAGRGGGGLSEGLEGEPSQGEPTTLPQHHQHHTPLPSSAQQQGQHQHPVHHQHHHHQQQPQPPPASSQPGTEDEWETVYETELSEAVEQQAARADAGVRQQGLGTSGRQVCGEGPLPHTLPTVASAPPHSRNHRGAWRSYCRSTRPRQAASPWPQRQACCLAPLGPR